MNKTLALLLAAFCLTAVGQVEVTYPYNPDNGDGSIGSPDLIELLTLYGTLFEPEALMVNDIPFQDWVDSVNNTLLSQQATIDSLMGSGVNQDNPCEGLASVNYHGVDYPIVAIGDQCWFAQELQTDKYNTGDPITASNSAQTTLNGGICLASFEPVVLVDTFNFSQDVPIGYYSYGVVQSDMNVCPQGWHVPLWSDVVDLGLHLGPARAGHDLKSAVFWDGADRYGFDARPTGLLRIDVNAFPFEGCLEAADSVLENSNLFDNDWTEQFMACEGPECDSINDALLLQIDNFNSSLPAIPHLSTFLLNAVVNFDEDYLDHYEIWLNNTVPSWPYDACSSFQFDALSDWLELEVSYLWIDQGDYAEWWIDHGLPASCEVQDAFMAVWGRRMNLIPLQRGDGLYHVPEINSPIRCIKDSE